MPETGDNAGLQGGPCRGPSARCFHFLTAAHPVLGAPTLNVGQLHGGLNINRDLTAR